MITDDKLEIYRLAFFAKLYELSGETFEVRLIRESYASDYQYRCYSEDGFSRATVCFEDGRHSELSMENIIINAEMIWGSIQLDREGKTGAFHVAVTANKRIDMLLEKLDIKL